MIQVKRKAPCTAATMQDAQNKNIRIHVKPTEAENQVLFDFLTKKSFIKSIFDLTESRLPEPIYFDPERYEDYRKLQDTFMNGCREQRYEADQLFCKEYAFGYEAGFIQGYLVAASLILTGRFCDD